MSEKTKEALDKVDQAMAILRTIAFPEGALDNLYAELTKYAIAAADPGYKDRCYCYLMFFGSNGRASYMKIGISNNPVYRLAGVSTGNPLKALWTFAMPFASRSQAGKVERYLHAAYATCRTAGEWFAIDQSSESDAEVIANRAGCLAANSTKPLGPFKKVA